MQAFLTALVPVIVGALVSVVMGGIKKVNAAIAKFPAIVQSLIVVAVSFGASIASKAIGVPVPGDLSGFSADVISTILTALSAMGIHAIYKSATTPAA